MFCFAGGNYGNRGVVRVTGKQRLMGVLVNIGSDGRDGRTCEGLIEWSLGGPVDIRELCGKFG